jgi:hypothetical protein
MYTEPKKVHQKLISFPDPIYKQIMLQVKRTGLSFSEFIRYMALQQTSKFYLSDEVEILDDKTSQEIAKGVKDMEKGDFVVLKTKKDIENYFRNL